VPYDAGNANPGKPADVTTSEPISQLYSRKILTYAADIPRLGRLDAPDASGDAVSRLCGSEVHVEINVEGTRVTDFAQEVKACALGQTSASIVGRNVIGATRDEISKARDQTAAMLKEGAPAPTGRFAELEVLAAVKDYPARHASVLLVFDALLKAFNELETST